MLGSPNVIVRGSESSGPDDYTVGGSAQQAHHHTIVLAVPAYRSPTGLTGHIQRNDSI